MKSKFKRLLIKLLLLLLFGLIYLGIGYLVAVLITKRFGYDLQEVMSYEGIILLFVGILMSMKGDPSGSSISHIGQKNENAISHYQLGVLRSERENKPYYKDFLNNNVVVFAFGNLTFILGGLLIIAFTLLFLY